MPVDRARFIPNLLQVHLEDLAFVAGQRRAALGSHRHTLREFGELNERLEGHLQGVLVAPPPVLVDLLRPQLAALDRDVVFAAAYPLLRLIDAAVTSIVVNEFSNSGGSTLAGLRDAFSLSRHVIFGAEMNSSLEHAKPATAAAAAVILANHRVLDCRSARLAMLLEDPDPTVCEAAWRAATVVDAATSQGAPKRPFKQALTHAAPAVRDAGWAAVAWSGQVRAMPLLRQLAVDGDRVAAHWLAVLGSDEDTLLMQNAALAADDPAARCALLARFGHPSALNALLRWMDPADVSLAAAAGEAFTRITGADIRGRRTTLPVPDDADEFTREMAPDVWLPDAAKAKALIDRHGAVWGAGHRWCKGVRVDGEVDREVLKQMDLEARWDIAARAAMAGRPVSAPPPIC